MLRTHQAVVRDGAIKLLEQVDLPEGTKVLVTVLQDDRDDFWIAASQSSLEKIWDNPEDDVYEELLER
ncbi:MAG: antitoxin family protein [Candidatus Poribacteria bacterium]|nr:antitoxin family protein [Candidatus Poribacteria bacterium]